MKRSVPHRVEGPLLLWTEASGDVEIPLNSVLEDGAIPDATRKRKDDAVFLAS